MDVLLMPHYQFVRTGLMGAINLAHSLSKNESESFVSIL